MATLKTSDADVKLFVDSDPYFFTIDNRPLRELLKNELAINDEVEDAKSKLLLSVSFVVESPSVESNVSGLWKSNVDGTILRSVVSSGTAGSGGDFIIDVFNNGNTIYQSPAARPVLSYNDIDKLVETTSPNISGTQIQVGDILTADVIQVQTGTPRWLRIEIEILIATVSVAASDYD